MCKIKSLYFETQKYRTIIANEIKNRYALGMSFEYYTRKNRCEHLKRFKGIHNGEECFIVGTGPSLQLRDIELLKKKKSFGVNTLYKIYNETDWRADYYCIIDPNTFSNVSDELIKKKIQNIFVAQNRIKGGIHDENFIGFNLDCSSFYRILSPQYFNGICDFSVDIADRVYDGASVVYSALQIAVYMGFKKIYLLGIDCNYDQNIKLHSDLLSYDKGYNYNWTQQTGLTMIEGFKKAKEFSAIHGIEILNATRGGMLEVFPRIDLDRIDWR